MKLRQWLLLGVGCVLLPTPLRAQTVLNLSNLPMTAGAGAGDTALDIANTGAAISNGAFLPGSVSVLGQAGSNDLNVIGSTGAPLQIGATPVSGSSTSIAINVIAAAGYGASGAPARTSLSISNTNVAATNGAQAIVGGLPIGSYGSQIANVIAGGSQSGANTLNAVSVGLQGAAELSLTQTSAVAPAGGGLVQPTAAVLAANPNLPYAGGAADPSVATTPVPPTLGMSVVNTQLGYAIAGSARVGGESGQAMANQSASNAFNAATVVGGQSVALQQSADFPVVQPFYNGGTWNTLPTTVAIQATNTAVSNNEQLESARIANGALIQGNTSSVSNVIQAARGSINTLALVPSAGASPMTTGLSGVQSGNLPWVIATNQAVASSGAAAGRDGILLSGNGSANWAGFAASLATANLPAPGTVASSAARPAASVTTISNVNQGLDTSLNTLVSGGSVSAGAAGFGQVIGSMGLANSVLNDAIDPTVVSMPPDSSSFASMAPAPVNASMAMAAAGTAAVTTVAQSHRVTGNAMAVTGNATGTFSQSIGTTDYNAAGLVPAAMQASFPGTAPRSGSGAPPGSAATPSAGPLIASPAAIGEGPALNGAYAATYGPGQSNLAGVVQSATGDLNTIAVTGALASGTQGTIAQSGGVLANYGGTLNKQIALTNGAGNAAITAPQQALAMQVNAIRASGSLSGSIAQQGPSSPPDLFLQPANAIEAASATSGSASIAGGGPGQTAQVNLRSYNSIATSGTMGTSSEVAAISQSSPAVGYVINGIAPPPTNGIQANAWVPATPPDRATNVHSSSTQITGAGQVSGLNVNSIYAGGGTTGMVAQVSNGIESTTSNVQSSLAGYCLTCLVQDAVPRISVGSGNVAITGALQANTQAANTATFGGAVNGTVNMAASGFTSLSTANVVRGNTNLGNTRVTGSQTGTNAVSVVTAPR